MSEKLTSLGEEQLLRARNEGLKLFRDSSMRPHGKLWGMDVFSWFNAEPSSIANTLHSFPFPVVWVGNGRDIKEALTEQEVVLSNLRAVVIYDSNIFNFNDSWLDGLKNCAGTQTVEDAFEFVKMLKAPQTVLIFTASGEKWEEQKESFEEFLKSVRI